MSDLQILQATYGVPGKQIDVTEKIKSLVAANQTIEVSNDLAGSDPALGETKTLTVAYVENGQQKTETAEEGETLVYTPPTGPSSSIAAGSTSNSLQAMDVQVLQAMYGFESEQMDVTDKVQSLVQSGQNVRVGNHLFGKDPAPGKVKSLSVVFSSGGTRQRSDIREGDQLSLAAATMLAVPPPELAPEGTYFLTAPTSVSNKKTGVIVGLRAGTAIDAVC